MPSSDMPDERLESELEQLLQELRVALPGIQILFAFLLTVPFANRFGDVTAVQKDIYFMTLIATLASSIFLIAPTSYHRIRWRQHRDPELMMRTFNAFVLVGLAFLAVALVSAILFVTDFIFNRATAVTVTSVLGALLLAVWYAVPLRRFLQDR